MTEADEDEKTDADGTTGRHEGGQVQEEEEWGQDDRTEVDAKPPVDAELAKQR